MNYQSSVEDVNSVTKVFTVSIPSSVVDERFNKELGSVAQKVSIKGFRPGKAPRDLVVKMHGKEIRADVMNKLISTSLTEIIKEHDLNYVGNPALDIESTEEGKDLKFKANFAIYPVPELKKYDSFKITQPTIEVTDTDIEQVITRIRNSSAEFNKVDRTTMKDGDSVQCKILAIVDGQSGPEPTPMRLEVGGPETPDEITEALREMKLGETRTVSVKNISELESSKNKKIEYQITADEIFEKILPELNDEFVQKIDNSVKTVVELKTKIQDLLKADREEQSRMQAEGMVLKDLAGNHTFELPQVMIDMEIYNMLARNRMIDPSKVSFDQFNAEPFREQMAEQAEERVKATVLVDRIAQEEKLMPSEEELKKWFDEQKEKLGEDGYNRFMGNRDYVQSAMVEFTRKKVLDFLLARTKIEYVTNEEFQKIEKPKKKETKPSKKAK